MPEGSDTNMDSSNLIITPLEQANYFIFVLFFLASFVYIFVKLFAPSRATHYPPGPYPWPVIGNILSIGKKPHISLAKLAKTYGPDLMFIRLGAKNVVVASSPAAAAEILRTHDKLLSGRYLQVVASKIPLYADTSIPLAEECHDTWRMMRNISHNVMFSTKALESQSRIREEKVMEMMNYLREREGESLTLEGIAFATIANALSKIMVSRDLIDVNVAGQIETLKGFMRSLIELSATPRLGDLFPYLKSLDLIGTKRQAMDVHQRIRSLWVDIINDRQKLQNDDVSNPDFFDILTRHGICNDKISILLTEMLTAGTDSTFTVIEWLMAELIKNQEILEQVRKEIAGCLNAGDTLVTESHLSRMPSLHACLKETLRLHPPGPFLIPHRALETCKVMNYVIPKDCLLLVNFWAISHDPDIWEEPLRFKPERFMESKVDFRGGHYEFIPFGAGRRMCPGLPVAMKQVELVVSNLLHFFDWSLPQGTDAMEIDMSEKFGMMLQMERPMLLVPTTRK